MSSQYWTTKIEREERSDATAMFDGTNGQGALLSPFWIAGVNFAVPTNETQATLGTKIINQFQTTIPTKLKEEIEKHNNTVLSIDQISVMVTWDKRAGGTWYDAAHLIFGMDLAQCGCTVSWSARVFTANQITESPFPAWGLTLLKDIIAAVIIALIAYWTIEAAKDLIAKWTTTTTKITTIKPDGTVVTEETTNPNLGGMSTLFIFAIIGVVVLLFVFGFAGRGKK